MRQGQEIYKYIHTDAYNLGLPKSSHRKGLTVFLTVIFIDLYKTSTVCSLLICTSANMPLGKFRTVKLNRLIFNTTFMLKTYRYLVKTLKLEISYLETHNAIFPATFWSLHAQRISKGSRKIWRYTLVLYIVCNIFK